MTSREIVAANLENESPPRPGFCFSGGRQNDFAIAGISVPENVSQQRWVEGGTEYYTDSWGNIWHRLVGKSAKGEVHKPVLASWDRLESLCVPDFDNPSLYQAAEEAFAAAPDRFRVLSLGGWIFDQARYLRRLDQYLMDLVENREQVLRINALVADTLAAKIRHAARIGADAVFFTEDWGTQTGPLIGPSMWREVFAEPYAELTSLAHGYNLKVIMHSCGYNWILLDDLIEAGIDCFQFDQPAAYIMSDLAAKLKRHRRSLFAPLDIQQVLPTGDENLIRCEARRLLDTFAGALLLKDYPDLHGIGVKPEWDQWAYEEFARPYGLL